MVPDGAGRWDETYWRLEPFGVAEACRPSQPTLAPTPVIMCVLYNRL
jgi:hypothetical protein